MLTASAKTAVFCLNCSLRDRQGQDTWYTPKCVHLSFWLSRFVTPFFHPSPLELPTPSPSSSLFPFPRVEVHMGRAHMAAHIWGYSKSFVMYFLLHSSCILRVHVFTSRQVWTQGSPGNIIPFAGRFDLEVNRRCRVLIDTVRDVSTWLHVSGCHLQWCQTAFYWEVFLIFWPHYLHTWEWQNINTFQYNALNYNTTPVNLQ